MDPTVNYTRDYRDFSVTDTMADLAMNRRFTDGHAQLKDHRDTERAFIWKALSALGDDISKTIYDNVVNYIDNVGNIDTCKVQALFSMSEVLGVTNNSLKTIIENMPDNVLRLMDLFSINRCYGTKYKVNNLYLRSELSDIARETLSDEIENVKNGIADFDIDPEEEVQVEPFGIAPAEAKLEVGTKEYVTLSVLKKYNISNPTWSVYPEGGVYLSCLDDGSAIISAHNSPIAEYRVEATAPGFRGQAKVIVKHKGSGIKSESILSAMNDSVMVSREAYRNFITEAFYDSISSKIFNPYTTAIASSQSQDYHIAPDGIRYPIYDVLLDERNLDEVLRGYTSHLKVDTENETISKLVRIYGIYDFDPYKIADRIEKGLDLIDNYKDQKLELIEMVLKDRADTLDGYANNPLTKYAYYHRKAAIDQLNFVNDIHDSIDPNSQEIEAYEIDNKFFDVTKANEDSISKDVVIPEGDSDFRIDISAIRKVAETLADVAISISDIREKLKTQAQRNYMRGSFLLISYIVSEYLRKNVVTTYAESFTDSAKEKLERTKYTDVQIIEYWDTTDYYNLSTDTSGAALSGNTVKYRFWEDDKEDITGVGLPLEEIDHFYMETLGLKSATDDLNSFLNIIYDLGADRGYIDKRTGNLVTGTDVDEIYEKVEPNFEKLSANYYALSNYQGQILLSYGGTKFSYDPYYNWKNMAHGSYQIHPYLYKFIRDSNMSYAIRSSFGGDANEEIIEALKTEAISNILGNMGNIINNWDRHPQDNTGWVSRYENETHNKRTNYGEISPVQHYDGVFYPKAVDEYIQAVVTNGVLDLTTDSALCVIGTVRGGVTSRQIVNAISNLLYWREMGESEQKWDEEIDKYIPSSVALYRTELNELSCKPWLSGFYENIIKLHNAEEKLLNEFTEKEQRKIAEKQRLEALNYEYPKTFYDKWYSHLDLIEEDLSAIANRLSVYAADILDIYRNRTESEPTHDIYKYGLDKYANSIILYKKYVLSDMTYRDKARTPGEIWIRTNGHPIGFPAFSVGELSGYSQIRIEDEENINTTLVRIIKDWKSHVDGLPDSEDLDKAEMLRRPRCFYDFDRTSDYKTLLFPFDVETEEVEDYEDITTTMVIRTWENPFDFVGNDKEARYSYHWCAPENQLALVTGKRGEWFQGMFQHPSTDEIYMLWATWMADNQSISIRKKRIPDGEEKSLVINVFSRNRIDTEFSDIIPEKRLETLSASMRGKSYAIIPFDIIDNGKNTVRISYAAQKGDYDNGDYTIAFITESEEDLNEPEQFIGQNYIGQNTVFLPEDTTLMSEFAGQSYGKMDYISQTKDPTTIGEDNSFDRIRQHLFLVSFNEYMFESPGEIPMDDTREYNLNSDASFIPLYEGPNGFIRLWATNLYKNNKINSLELLGPTFNTLSTVSSDFSLTLFDDDGTLTGLDPASLLSSSFRVYEQYGKEDMYDPITGEYKGQKDAVDRHFTAKTNPVSRVSNGFFTWDIDLQSLALDTSTSDNYKVLVYNMARGAATPIIACDLSTILVDPESAVHYRSKGTKADDYYLSNRYSPPYFVDVVGTPNVFPQVGEFDANIVAGETNYIMGIDKLTASLNGSILTLRMRRQNEVRENFVNTQQMILDKNSLVAMVYDLNLSEFDTMHMMHHHLEWPFTSVLNKGHIIDEDGRESISLNSISSLKLSDYRGILYSPLDLPDGDDPLNYISALTDTAEENKKYLSIITEGSYSFKIGEQMNDGFRFPPAKYDDSLKQIFNSINKNVSELSQFFKIFNTYIFEVQRPLEIAKIMGGMEMNVYADDYAEMLVCEEWISNMYHVSKYETEFLDYLLFMEDGTLSSKMNGVIVPRKTSVTESTSFVPPESVKFLMLVKEDPSEYSFALTLDESKQPIEKVEKNDISKYLAYFDLESEEESTVVMVGDEMSPCLERLNTRNGEEKLEDYLSNTLKPTAFLDNDEHTKSYCIMTTEEGYSSEFAIAKAEYEVTEQDVKDFMKIYVNWAKQEDGIHLYFNYNNYFNSPYSYRNSNGDFATKYNPNTYLHLLPPGHKDGKDSDMGDLNVIVQLKYFNYEGRICGTKDVPIINYTIKNVSDDKPKFSIVNTWVTSTAMIRASKKAEPPKETSALLKIEWKRVGYDPEYPGRPNELSTKMFEDYTTSEDISSTVKVTIESECCKIGAITADIVYEYTDENVELLPEMCSGQDAIFDFSKNGMVNVRTTQPEFEIAFNVKKGSLIDDETCQLRVPVDAINFRAKTEELIDVDHTFTQLGGLIFDFSIDGKFPDRFLALEKNIDEHGKKVFDGFEISETRKLIKIFQNKKYSDTVNELGGGN